MPRPFTEQPTDRLTFAPGIRMIEGVQEFVLIVSRPSAATGLCIEASLDTAHFPGRVDYEEQPPPTGVRDRRDVEFSIEIFAPGGGVLGLGRETVQIESNPWSTFRAPDGWIIDREAAGQGVEEIEDTSSSNASANLTGYHYGAIDSATVRVTGSLTGRPWIDQPEVVLRKKYRVHLLRQSAAAAPPDRRISTTMLTTTRHLKVCYSSRNGCPEITDSRNTIAVSPSDLLLRERTVVAAGEGLGAFLGGFTSSLMQNIQSALVTNVSTSPHAPPPTSFMDTNYFQSNILATVKQRQPDLTVGDLQHLPPKFQQLEALNQYSVDGLLAKSLATLRSETGLALADAIELRRLLVQHLTRDDSERCP